MDGRGGLTNALVILSMTNLLPTILLKNAKNNKYNLLFTYIKYTLFYIFTYIKYNIYLYKIPYYIQGLEFQYNETGNHVNFSKEMLKNIKISVSH